MLLGRIVLSLSLNQRELGVIGEFLCQRSFADQRHAIVVYLLCAIHGLQSGFDIVFCFGQVVLHSCRRRCLVCSLRLLKQSLAFLGSRDEIAVFQDRQELSLADTISPIYKKLLNRRSYFRND